jgi:hypothetical protein
MAEVCMIGHENKLYPAEEIIQNFLGTNALVGPETWEELSKLLPKTVISGQDESGDKPASYECLVLGPQKFIVRVEDGAKVPR